MKTLFLAFAFRPEDEDLASQVEQLLASHDVRVTTGERVGGAALTPAIRARIESGDGLVALLTRRAVAAGARSGTHPWVLDELSHARAVNKRTIALVENGVRLGGAYEENEYINYDRANPLPAFLALSDTISLWKAEDGRTVKVKILPLTLARKVLRGNGDIQCRHRLNLQGRYTDWTPVEPVPEPGGAVVFIEGVRDEHTIQLEVRETNGTWLSEVTPQLVQIQLTRRGARR
jgi:hypothetical protein